MFLLMVKDYANYLQQTSIEWPTSINPLSANSDQRQFSPNNPHTCIAKR